MQGQKSRDRTQVIIVNNSDLNLTQTQIHTLKLTITQRICFGFLKKLLPNQDLVEHTKGSSQIRVTDIRLPLPQF